MIFWCLYLLMLLVVSVSVLGQAPSSKGFINIDCGLASNNSYVNRYTGLIYVSDDQYIDTGVKKHVAGQYANEDLPDTYTLRSFPNGTRNCYTLTGVTIGLKYLVRAHFLHGDYDGLGNYPQFDLYFGVNFWDTVHIDGYDEWYPYEIIVVTSTNYIQVCLVNTRLGTPFINTLELRPLNSTMYQHANSTQSLNLYARVDLGSNDSYVRYPSDAYDRIWSDRAFFNNVYPSWFNYAHNLPNISTNSPIQDLSFGIPSQVLQTAAISSAPKNSIDLTWSTSNMSTSFGIILHFVEIEILERNILREFDVYVNGVHEYRYSNISFLATSYSSFTMMGNEFYNVSLESTPKATLPPMVNALEQYTILPVILFPTYDGDVTAINSIKASYSVHKDWNGDPCVPTSFSWTGVNCTTNSSSVPRITALNLSSNRLTGEFVSAFGNLTAVETLDLSHNNLTGHIPSSLDQLISLTFLDLSENSGLNNILPPGLLKKRNDGLLKVKFNRIASKPDTKKSSKGIIVVAVVIPFLLAGVIAVLFFLYLKKQIINGLINPFTKEIGKDVPHESEQISNEMPRSESSPEADETFEGGSSRSVGPVQYRLGDLKDATEDFSDCNKIGNGGFGVVYKGLIDGEMVAIKELHGSPVCLLGDVAKEVRLISFLRNDNLVKLLGFCAEAGHYLLVYEYLSNGDLSSWLTDETKRQTLDWEKRFKIIKGIVRCLSYLHNNSENIIIHRDIKPANILLDENYKAKVADFGLSKIFDTSKTHEKSKKQAGTAGYMAPELWFAHHYSHKTDVFSYGVLILEILIGSTIQGYAQANHENLSHVVWKQWKNKRPLIEIIDLSIRDKCPEDQMVRCILIGLLCIQHDPKKRPTMKQVLEMLNTNDPLSEPSVPAFLQEHAKSEDSSSHIELRPTETAISEYSSISTMSQSSKCTRPEDTMASIEFQPTEQTISEDWSTSMEC